MKTWKIVVAGVGISAGATLLIITALYKHGVEIMSLEIEPRDNKYNVTASIKNKSNIERSGAVELALDDHIHDWQLLTLQPNETWSGTTEVYAEKEICVCVDTFNKDLLSYPFFLRPANSKCKKI